jgi:hypothetical protein
MRVESMQGKSTLIRKGSILIDNTLMRVILSQNKKMKHIFLNFQFSLSLSYK